MKRQSIKKSDLNVIKATFSAIAAAEGWDRAFPESLSGCVMARLSLESPDVISHFDDELRTDLHGAWE